MISIHAFTFGPFAENTYVLSNESGDCFIIDPGCYFPEERQELREYITDNKLRPVRLLNTHAHLDHVLGNAFAAGNWKLKPAMHRDDLYNLERFDDVCRMYGVPGQTPPSEVDFLEEGDTVSLGDDTLEVLFTPGHSAGSISFYCPKQDFIIGGDVLFQGSIGRTDLPGGDFDTLSDTIKNKFYTLPPQTIVYSGHGPETTIAFEREHNPFVQA